MERECVCRWEGSSRAETGESASVPFKRKSNEADTEINEPTCCWGEEKRLLGEERGKLDETGDPTEDVGVPIFGSWLLFWCVRRVDGGERDETEEGDEGKK